MFDDSRIRDIIYKRRNGDNIVNDPEAIKSCKNEQSRDIIDNARVGSYDKFGNYIIIPDIKRELIRMPKLVYNTKHSKDSITYEAKGNIPIFGDVFFKLTLNKSEAVLCISESVKREANGYLEVYDEAIDSCLCGDGGLPTDIIFRNYNIKETLDDFGKNTNLYDYNNILTRKVYLSLLSKELNAISKVDEKAAFDKMVKTLKEGGEYGKKVLTEFVSRLKDRPGVFEIERSDKYNKAINEVLLSSLEVVTTEEDKENFEKRETYLAVLNARNENIDKYIEEANKRVDEERVNKIVKETTENYNAGKEKGEEETSFVEDLKEEKPSTKKRKLDKAVLKQGKEPPEEQKEDKKEEKKTEEDKKQENKPSEKKDDKKKKTEKGKKLKPASKAKKSSKLKTKKPAKKKAKKKIAKGKVKKKKKVAKAKSPQKAKGKVGGSLKAGGKPKKKKKDDGLLLTRLLVNKYFDKPEVEEQSIVSRIRENIVKEEKSNVVKEEKQNVVKQEKVLNQKLGNPFNIAKSQVSSSEQNNALQKPDLSQIIKSTNPLDAIPAPIHEAKPFETDMGRQSPDQSPVEPENSAIDPHISDAHQIKNENASANAIGNTPQHQQPNNPFGLFGNINFHVSPPAPQNSNQPNPEPPAPSQTDNQ